MMFKQDWHVIALVEVAELDNSRKWYTIARKRTKMIAAKTASKWSDQNYMPMYMPENWRPVVKVVKYDYKHESEPFPPTD